MVEINTQKRVHQTENIEKKLLVDAVRPLKANTHGVRNTWIRLASKCGVLKHTRRNLHGVGLPLFTNKLQQATCCVILSRYTVSRFASGLLIRRVHSRSQQKFCNHFWRQESSSARLKKEWLKSFYHWWCIIYEERERASARSNANIPGILSIFG